MAVLTEPALPPQLDVRGDAAARLPDRAEHDRRGRRRDSCSGSGPTSGSCSARPRPTSPTPRRPSTSRRTASPSSSRATDAADVLAKGCALDLDRFEPGGCAQTLLARAQVILSPAGPRRRGGSSCARRSPRTCAPGSRTRSPVSVRGVTRLLALCAVVLLTACGASTSESDPPLHVADRRAADLAAPAARRRAHHRCAGRMPAPLGKAWQAFEQFAALDVAGGDIEDDAFLFEAGVYDSGTKWGRLHARLRAPVRDEGRRHPAGAPHRALPGGGLRRAPVADQGRLVRREVLADAGARLRRRLLVRRPGRAEASARQPVPHRPGDHGGPRGANALGSSSGRTGPAATRPASSTRRGSRAWTPRSSSSTRSSASGCSGTRSTRGRPSSPWRRRATASRSRTRPTGRPGSTSTTATPTRRG